MARDRDDDRDDSRDDDRPRSRRRDNDDPPKKSNTGKILLIVGLCVGIPLLICVGIIGFGLMNFNIRDQCGFDNRFKYSRLGNHN